jgi:hypothetical protein
MASNLQVENVLSATAQSVKDQNGNISPLALSTAAVGIGTTNPTQALDMGGRSKNIKFDYTHIGETGGGAATIIANKARVNVTENNRVDFSRSNEDGVSAIELLYTNGISFFTKPIDTGNPTVEGDQFFSFNDRTHERMRISSTGNIGIGTTTPSEKLEVNGNIRVTGDVILTGADCAEDFDVKDAQALEPGTVMVIGDEDRLHESQLAYDSRVAGVLSGAGDYRPGIILGKEQSQNNRLPLALSGKVFCKVDAQYSPIGVGDLLTTSPTPGHAMKATDPLKAFGAVIGKALRPLVEGQGLIPILIALH